MKIQIWITKDQLKKYLAGEPAIAFPEMPTAMQLQLGTDNQIFKSKISAQRIDLEPPAPGTANDMPPGSIRIIPKPAKDPDVMRAPDWVGPVFVQSSTLTAKLNSGMVSSSEAPFQVVPTTVVNNFNV